MISQEELGKLFNQAEENLRELSKVILEGKKPPAGPYAFFHHSSYSLERLQNCKLIAERLFNQRNELSELGKIESSYLIENCRSQKPFSSEAKKIFQESHKLTNLMKTDMESLYMFGGILLDQWSLQAIIVGGGNIKTSHPFSDLVVELEKNNLNTLAELWKIYSEALLWLFYNFRIFRNRFIVHSNRPRQRGSTMSVHGNDFQFFTPTPPGWLNDKELLSEIRSFVESAPPNIIIDKKSIKDKNSHTLLETMFNNIGKYEHKGDREKIATLFSKVGGSTPTFQIVLEKLIRLVSESTLTLIKLAKENIDSINLGEPYRLS